ncbi:MAG TPA: hypothetical protein VGM89_16145, partial [Puia sp.]
MYRTILFVFFLLTLARASAQTDTVKPPSAQPDTPIIRLTHADSVRRDSLAGIRRARRDSIRLVRLAARKDSIAAAQRDSAARAANPGSAANAGAGTPG